MSSDTAVDIVHRGEELHRKLGCFYRNLRQRATNERVKLALDFLEQHEAGLESALRAYEKDLPHPHSERWFKYSPNEEMDKIMKGPVAPDLSMRDLDELAQRLSLCILRYYKQFAETAVPEELVEAMRQILQMEEEAQKKVARAMQEGA